MLILGIESSCDETAFAIVEDGRRVLASAISSQIEAHRPFGGVVPELAAREHLSVLRSLTQELWRQTNLTLKDIDAIGVTQGPGLVGSLLVGSTFAKGLALASSRPLIPVNHVHGHIYGALLDSIEPTQDMFPALALVVSGGHTNLYYMASPTSFRLVAHSMDDACGESFDKVAKLLGMPYPGGPHIERWAALGNSTAVTMPTMVERKATLSFSYSGLKTAVVNHVHKAGPSITDQFKYDLCAAFQEEALGQIVRKLKEAHRLYPDVKSLILAGGVAANQRFRNLLSASWHLPVVFPQLKYCSDNAAMIAGAAYFEWIGSQDRAPYHDLGWDVYSKYPFARFIV